MRRGAGWAAWGCWLAALVAAAPRGQARAAAVVPVVDLHVDLPWQLHYKGRALDLSKGMASARTLQRGHVQGVVLPIYIPDRVRRGGAEPQDMEDVYATITRLVADPASPFRPRAQAEQGQQVRGWLSIEGAQALARSPEAIGGWVARGVRLVGLAHGSDNDLSGSATGARRGGLTEAGKQLASKALEAGALLDVSHLSDAAFDEVAALSRAAGVPFVASHSNARALAHHPRNLTDAQLRAIAASGGVVGVNFHAPYVADGGAASLAQVVAQVEYLVRVAGEDAVAIGSDFDGGIRPADELPDASAFPRLAEALAQRGHSEERVHKIFSRNALRVLDGAARAP